VAAVKLFTRIGGEWFELVEVHPLTGSRVGPGSLPSAQPPLGSSDSTSLPSAQPPLGSSDSTSDDGKEFRCPRPGCHYVGRTAGYLNRHLRESHVHAEA